MRNPCREKEQRHRVWSDSRAGYRLPKDRGHRVCTCVPIALHTAEWGTEMAGSVCAQGRCSWGALIFINNWGNGLFLSGENSVYLLIDQYWRTGWPDVYIQVTQTSSKGSIGIHRDTSRRDRLPRSSDWSSVSHALWPCRLRSASHPSVCWKALHQDAFP